MLVMFHKCHGPNQPCIISYPRRSRSDLEVVGLLVDEVVDLRAPVSIAIHIEIKRETLSTYHSIGTSRHTLLVHEAVDLYNTRQPRPSSPKGCESER